MPGSRGMPGRSLAGAASPYLRRLYDVADAVAPSGGALALLAGLYAPASHG